MTKGPIGRLFLVGTPIGNLGDISERAVQTLREVDLIACEDTRRSRVLFERFGVETRAVSLPAFDEKKRTPRILEALLQGRDVALVTDAGMPGVSDPGEELVRQAIAKEVEVIPIPGPTAAIAALAASGLPTSTFAFFGFLPRKGTSRKERLEEIARFSGTIILYESPRRLSRTLEDLLEALGDRDACVARELTKLHETFVRGTLSSLVEHFEGEVPGEITLVIAGKTDVPDREDPDEILRALLAKGVSVKDASKEVSSALGIPRKDVYRRALELASEES